MNPLLIGLAAPRLGPQDPVVDLLRSQYGMAAISMQLPLYEAAGELYGFNWREGTYSRDQPIEHLGKSPRELAEDLAAHTRERSPLLLPTRAVQRLSISGDWLRSDIVIRDISHATEIAWLRQMGGCVWWVRGRQEFKAQAFAASFAHLFLCHFEPGIDAAIIDAGTPEELEIKVELELQALRTRNTVPPRPQPIAQEAQQ
jgi:hypothetical protein